MLPVINSKQVFNVKFVSISRKTQTPSLYFINKHINGKIYKIHIHTTTNQLQTTHAKYQLSQNLHNSKTIEFTQHHNMKFLTPQLQTTHAKYQQSQI